MDKTLSISFKLYMSKLFTGLFSSMKHEDRGVRNVKMAMTGYVWKEKYCGLL
jgi:hypothetical protein